MYQTSLLNPPTRKVTLPWNGAICKSIIVPIVYSVRVLGFQKCESLGSHLNAGKRDQPGIMAAKSLAVVAIGRQKQPLTQECIPVGCIPSAAVAICWGGGGGGGWWCLPAGRFLDTRLWKHYLSATSFADGNDSTSHQISSWNPNYRSLPLLNAWLWRTSSRRS